MSLLFNRKISLQVGNPDQPIPLVRKNSVLISNLRITFDIKKTSTIDYNTADIAIYNLSEATRAQVDLLGGLVIVNAGYENLQEVIFVGNTTFTSSHIERPDIVTKIIANDGYSQMQQFKIPSSGLSGSYAAGISAKKILNDIIKHSGITFKNKSVLDKLSDKKYSNGFCFAGSGKILLSNVCSYLGLEWTIQNNEIKLIPIFSSDIVECALLTPDSGLIGSPEKIQDVGKELYGRQHLKKKVGTDTTILGEKKRKKISGAWKVTSLLHPKIEPGSIIVVQCNDIPTETKFRVIEVEHKGDTHSSDWYTISTVMAVDNEAT